MSSRTHRTAALACAGLLAAALTGTSATAGAQQVRAVDGLSGPRGLGISPRGTTVVTEANGKVSRVIKAGDQRGTTEKIGKVPAQFIAPAVAVGRGGEVWVLTVGGLLAPDGAGTLYLLEDGKRHEVANIQRWQRQNPDPYDLEGRAKESNPYGVAAMADGSAVVADAANNSVVHVTRDGEVTHVARVKPRVVAMPAGYADPELPPAGTPMPAEAVVTSVTVGPDGAIYLGELRGFPATPGTSEIWRVEPGATGAVCNPKKPQKGECTRVADGLTSVVSLASGRGGALYAAELSKKSWFAVENEVAGSEEGSVIRIGHDRDVRRELSPGNVVLPGSVAVGRGGHAFVSGPIFGPGQVMKVG